MVYVDWYYEKAKKERKLYEKRKDGYRGWKDLVTGTNYCISTEDYGRIDHAGKKLLEQYLKEGSIDKMEKLFYGEGETKEAQLFADLPYFMDLAQGIKECARIRDYVCFRTACLYVLKYPSIQNSPDMVQEKAKIRMQGFTWQLVNSAEESPELEQIEQMICRQNKEKGCLDTDMADLVKGGLVKIKQYYLETNKIPEIRGASLLLEKVNTEKMKQLISQEHIRECLIYAGGGKMMGIFPEGKGEETCQKIGVMTEKETVTAQFNFCSRPYKLQRLIDEYQSVVDEMDLALEERQGLRWDFRLEPQADEKVLEEAVKGWGWKKIKETKQEFCTSCRNRYAVAVLHEGTKAEEMLCPSCMRKKQEGGRDAKRSRHREYKDFVKRKYNKVIEDTKCYNKLEYIAQNGFVGVIYGDANNMSSHINNLKSFLTMRYFSEVTADSVTEVVFEALYKNLGDKLAFEVIAVGGDDIFLIVPGPKAYDIACTIGKIFDQKFQNQSNEKCQMTMSIGVCIAHDHMPVQYSFAIAQKLLKSAKHKAWQEREKGNNTGTIDWMVIENEIPGGADIAYQRMAKDDKPKKTLRPYTWTQADAMKKFLKKIEKEKSFAFQLQQSWYQHIKEEAELFFEYQVGRKEETKEGTKVKCGLGRLAKAFEGEAVNQNLVCQGVAYSPWVDAIELWDYTGDTK